MMRVATMACVACVAAGSVWAQEAPVALPQTIPEVVLPAPDLQRYVPALQDPTLAARLTGPGPMTAFVPNGTPALRLPGAPVWPKDPDEAARLARAMVADGLWTTDALRRGIALGNDRLILETDSGASLLVAPAGDGGLMVVDPWGNTAQIVGPMRRAQNGGVLVLDAPLAID